MEQREWCDTCKFWKRNNPGSQKGGCRRFPPIMVGSALRVETGWPQTSVYEWCGEHRLKPAKDT